MKQEQIPILAVFKNGIVNLNNAIGVIPSAFEGIDTEVITEKSELTPVSFRGLVPLSRELVGNRKTDTRNTLIDVVNLSTSVDELKNLEISSTFTFVCDSNGDIKMCLVNTENFRM